MHCQPVAAACPFVGHIANLRSEMLRRRAGAARWPIELLSSVLRLAFQNLLQEQDDGVKAVSQQLWQRLLRQLAPATLAQAILKPVIQVQLLASGWMRLCHLTINQLPCAAMHQ